MKSFVKFGLFTGLAVSAWNLSCFTIVNWLNRIFSLDIPAARIRAYSGLFGLIILILGIFLGMREVKRKNHYTISYGQALKVGISISLISACIAGLFALAYCTLINPGYQDFMVREAESALIAAKNSPEEIGKQLEKVRSQFSTSNQVLQGIIAQSVIGTLSSLILGLFIKTKK